VTDSLPRRLHAAAHLTGEFRLRSGATATEYFDKYRFESDPQLLRAVAERLAPLVPEGTQALAGLELGGVPIATMLAQVTGLPAVFVRKRAKAYGTARLAEGLDVKDLNLLVVEDVVTSGGQLVESTQELRALGATVAHAVCVIDREAGGVQHLADVGVTLRAAFTLAELNAAAASA
jgi:orotate phosphoribosyltransferase